MSGIRRNSWVCPASCCSCGRTCSSSVSYTHLGHYQINNASSALLTETADAGSEYQDSTLFLGDSNTVRLYNNGLISLQQFCAREGIGTQVALNLSLIHI